MSATRDRSVVTSSVIPSAKYCWSGSLLRLANGNTTIDRRGATSSGESGVAAATAGGGEDFVTGQSHHAPAAATSSAATTALNAMCVVLRRRGAAIGTIDAGKSAIASGRS